MTQEERTVDETPTRKDARAVGSNGKQAQPEPEAAKKGPTDEEAELEPVAEDEFEYEDEVDPATPAKEAQKMQQASRRSQREPKKRGQTFRRVKQAGRAAHVVAHRQDYVDQGLSLLHNLGFLDQAARDRLWTRYQEGDDATRRLLQEQVQRILAGAGLGNKPQGGAGERSPGGRAGGADAPTKASDVDPKRIERGELEILKSFASEHVDVRAVANQIQHLDPMRWLGDPKDPGPLMRFFSEVPLVVHRFQRRVLWAGISMFVFAALLVGTAITVPAIVPYVGLGGVVLLALLFGYWLIRGSLWVDRSVKKQGIDLDVYARLPDDERRVLLIRRIGMRVLDPQKLGAALERSVYGTGTSPGTRNPSSPSNPSRSAHERGPVGPSLAADDEPAPIPPEPEERTQDETQQEGPPSRESETPHAPVRNPTRSPEGRVKRVLEFTRDMIDRTVGPREQAKQTAKELGHDLTIRAKQAGRQLDDARQKGQKKWEEHRARKTESRSTPKAGAKKAVKKQSPGKAATKKRTAKKGSGKQPGAGKKQSSKKRSGAARKGAKKAPRKAAKKKAKKQAGKVARKAAKKSASKKSHSAKKAGRSGRKPHG